MGQINQMLEMFSKEIVKDQYKKNIHSILVVNSI